MVARKPRRTGKTRKNETRSKRKPRWGILLAVCVLAAAVAGGLAVWQTYLRPTKIRNVLLVSIDTCRSDHLSCYGYPTKTTPNVDAVAAEGTLFRNAYSPAPMTGPAHCSMLTGTIPPYHGVHENLQYGFAEEETLARILKTNGLQTCAIVSSYILDGRYGLSHGFDEYSDNMPPGLRGKIAKERKGGDTTRLALDYLQRSRNKPFFLFLHYYDPHQSYDPPEPFASRFRTNPYAGEIAYVDSCIGQVIAKLKELALYDSTLLVITSDHGEMLGEHGEEAHSFFIYQGAAKVVLITRVPGQKRARVVQEPVGLIDIVPTVCGLLRLKPPPHVHGVNLASCVKGRGRAPAARYLYLESLYPTIFGANSLLGLVQDNSKYIQTTRPELYDLDKDPREEQNLASAKPELAATLQSHLKSLLGKEVRAPQGGKTSEWDPKAIAHLAALGYVQGTVVEDFAFSTDKEDPKDVIRFSEGIARAQSLQMSGQYPEARKLCDDLIVQRPEYAKTYSILGTMALEQGDFAGAVNAFAKAIERDPQEYLHYSNVAPALMELGRVDEAFQHFQQAEKLEPRSGEVQANYGLALVRTNRLDEALQRLRKALQLDPKNDVAHQGLAQVYLAQGNKADAIAECAKALEINPGKLEIRNNLAQLHYENGDRQKALAGWTESLRLNPNQPAVLDSCARVFLEQGQPEQALQCLQNLLRLQAASPQIMSRIALLKSDPRSPRCSNPPEALALAQTACQITANQDPLALHALASALAASQRYVEAADVASRALKLAEKAKDPSLAARINTLLETCERSRQEGAAAAGSK